MKLKVNKEFLIWLAGFVDGDGSIQLTKGYRKKSTQNTQHALKFSIGQNDRGIINYIGRIVEFGAIHQLSPTFWEIRFYSNQACTLLKQLLPFLKLKKLETRLAIQFQENKSKYKGRGYSLSKNELKWREMHFQLLKHLKKNRRFIDEIEN